MKLFTALILVLGVDAYAQSQCFSHPDDLYWSSGAISPAGECVYTTPLINVDGEWHLLRAQPSYGTMEEFYASAKGFCARMGLYFAGEWYGQSTVYGHARTCWLNVDGALGGCEDGWDWKYAEVHCKPTP